MARVHGSAWNECVKVQQIMGCRNIEPGLIPEEGQAQQRPMQKENYCKNAEK
jgi:hypothetical protein